MAKRVYETDSDELILAAARQVLAGDYSALPPITEDELFDTDEWRKEAQSALDGADEDFRWMLTRERVWQWFQADQRRGCDEYGDPVDEYSDFDDYFDRWASCAKSPPVWLRPALSSFADTVPGARHPLQSTVGMGAAV